MNNAAFQMVQMGGIADITTEQFDRVMKTNLYALFWLSKAAIAQMEPGSTIVNTSSHPRCVPVARAARLRHDKGGHHRLHKGTGRRCRTKGNQGQCRCTWTDLDATDSGHDAQGEVRDVRGRRSARAGRSAGRACSRLCISRLWRIQLHHWGSHRRDGWKTAHLTTLAATGWNYSRDFCTFPVGVKGSASMNSTAWIRW